MKAKTPYQKKRKRVGRGTGSGHGKTSSRGHKGQGSRSGAQLTPGFEGGQNPLYRRLPKRGFNRARFQKRLTAVNLGSIAEIDQKEISPEALISSGFVKKIDFGLKILGYGELKKAITVKAHKFSASAKEKIEKAGGKAIVLETIPQKKDESAAKD